MPLIRPLFHPKGRILCSPGSETSAQTFMQANHLACSGQLYRLIILESLSERGWLLDFEYLHVEDFTTHLFNFTINLIAGFGFFVNDKGEMVKKPQVRG
jgi:hypothetical protein